MLVNWPVCLFGWSKKLWNKKVIPLLTSWFKELEKDLRWRPISLKRRKHLLKFHRILIRNSKHMWIISTINEGHYPKIVRNVKLSLERKIQLVLLHISNQIYKRFLIILGDLNQLQLSMYPLCCRYSLQPKYNIHVFS